MTFVVLRHGLASIIGHIVHHFQQIRTPSHYSDVVHLDEELLQYINNLPSHFSLEPDTSLDETLKFIPVHRFLLITETLFVRISLHRPYLLRRLETERYNRSRAACFESAIKDFQVRQWFREYMPKEARDSLSNAYREFQTAMISGIYLVLYRNGPNAKVMHGILDAFMKDHEGVREMDETTRRELKTIEFLKNKSSQMEDTRSGTFEPVPSYAESTPDHTEQPAEAQLLLGLQRSESRTPNKLSLPSRPSGPQTKRPSPLSSPPTSFATASQHIPSPAIQRLQQTTNVDGHTHSPAGSGSPGADDESAAQSLLDHWCNTVSNGPTLDGAMAVTGMSWGGSGGSDFPMWAGATPPVLMNDSPLLTGLDGSDWNYWEALVNQIQPRATPSF
jgi:hypothetical protein